MRSPEQVGLRKRFGGVVALDDVTFDAGLLPAELDSLIALLRKTRDEGGSPTG